MNHKSMSTILAVGFIFTSLVTRTSEIHKMVINDRRPLCHEIQYVRLHDPSYSAHNTKFSAAKIALLKFKLRTKFCDNRHSCTSYVTRGTGCSFYNLPLCAPFLSL